ncbi:MAG: nitrous oxide reductase family maturation protein NosD [Ignavibacteriae bacterium]|nr:nitrous oxide reductase family maturation protein NosD [Ignavibacteriota bacterium]
MIKLSKILSILFSLSAISGSFSKDIPVGENEIVKSIKQAIESAYDGDRIIIKYGIYKEHNIIVNKSLQIIGENNPVIDGEGADEIFAIRKNGCSIQNLIIRNTGISFMKDIAGVKVENCKNINIENNILENTFFSIFLSGADSCKVISNKIKGNATSESFSGNGIHLWKCSHINIDGNEMSGQRDGIYFEFATNCKIKNNFSHNNLRYGLHFMFSEGNSYVKNTFRENGAGVAVMYTKRIEMIENNFENNWGPNSYGLLLKDIDKSIIKNNTFTRNTTGIYIEGSNGTSIITNNFNANGWAIKILGNCYEDSVTYNNFFNNTFDVATNSSQNSNYFDSNYWDKYKGYDLDKNNTGDVSYRPVSLFATVIESSPDAILLLRSFIVDLLDLTEKVFPVFIPETLIDNNPQMKMITYDKN